MKRRYIMLCVLAFLVSATHALAGDTESVPVFTFEEQILSVSRQDQSNPINTRMVKREVLLTEVIKVLTTYRKVTKHQYMIYAHQPGLSGTVTLIGEKKYTWSIEPGYAATVKSEGGEEVYLFRPQLKTEPPAGGDGKPAPQP